MTESAKNDGGGLRERKRAATRLAITDAARALTAAHGVNGFTVEQLCEEVGISRRTFFNYFPGKEDAIFGDPLDHIPEELARAFVDGGRKSAPPAEYGALTPTLLEDFSTLACAMMERLAMNRQQTIRLKRAIAAEPRLLAKATHGTRQTEEAFAQLLAARERLLPHDARIRVAVSLLSALTQRAGAEFLAEWNTRSYRDILAETVQTARAILAAERPVHPGS
ncbi:TetR family transcriptional regulator [Arthrobacter crystallopoietes BAB-32]|uniref:TetR family transcriptional regulator n=1 Tax=Arthrobacter crystallopoietes BAB-32 TaxID=1246476 RepID=N1VD00_9MICC|nr:TetR family transcriptional regulator [Arthrobacter crystallopoietes]EMY36183.1 TetR family transcriptional regulator [Arthrobacter crystallopoietes BAB-32]